MITCDICLKSFSRRDNMLRHRNSAHNRAEEVEDTESVQSDTNTDLELDESETETTPEYSPWDSIVNVVFEKLQPEFEKAVKTLQNRDGIDESEASDRIYEDMRSTFRKAIMKNFMDRMDWFREIQHDPVYRAIKQTVNHLTDAEDYGREEAWKYAASKRKYLFDKILIEYSPPDIHSEER